MEASEKKALIVIAIVLAALVAASVIAVAVKNNRGRAFEPPELDPRALTGKPENLDEQARYGELELPISDGQCKISMAALPSCEKTELGLFFTSDKDNSVYVRAVVYTAEGVELGSSGLLRPGEYLPSVTLAEEVSPSVALRVKILTYDPDNYYSMGSAGAEIRVR